MAVPGFESTNECNATARRRLAARVVASALAPVDGASLAAFRVAVGLALACWCLDDLRTGRVHELYVAARFHFTYYLFDFVRPWPGNGMVWHYGGLLVLALAVAAGFLYRAAAFLFALGFTYFFLLDRTNYQNHYYLLTLVSWTLAILPLNRLAAVDPVLGLSTRSGTVPRWCLWLMRFHIALPYAFGGIAKLHPDWFAGEPLRTHLASLSEHWPQLAPVMASEITVSVLIWGGLLFDVLIVPLLLWRPTRGVAYLLCLGFHLTNAFLFHIHVFPWFMIVATTIFFSPDWPRRLLRRPLAGLSGNCSESQPTASRRQRVGLALLGIYCAAQLVVPLRHFLYAGNSLWTERGHHFSWRMMMRTKDSAIWYYVTDAKSGRTGSVDLSRFVNLEQLTKFSRDPEMILHLAHYIAQDFRRVTGRQAEVRALVLTSLNGRKPELLVDPNINLAHEPRGFYARTWILPQREPLPAEIWKVPMKDWRRSVEIPPLTFLTQPASALPSGIAHPSNASPRSPAGTGLAVHDTP